MARPKNGRTRARWIVATATALTTTGFLIAVAHLQPSTGASATQPVVAPARSSAAAPVGGRLAIPPAQSQSASPPRLRTRAS
ncbi:MAG TPA: hypothetical protein VFC51_09960 [Chloroflexota bacterium]|nr:hypothetical protein [Chloroflexota bacterium]